MKNEENQVLKHGSWSFPLIGLVLLFVLAFLPFGRTATEEKVVRARTKAEVLAYQVAQLYRESLSAPSEETPSFRSNRLPAAVPKASPAEGMMGEDPWGRAYNYRILVADDGRLRVEMKSAGPDGILDLNSADDIHLTLSF